MDKHFINIENYFNNLENIKLNNKKLELFFNGVQLSFDLNDGIYKIYDMQNKFIGLATLKNKLLKRDIII